MNSKFGWLLGAVAGFVVLAVLTLDSPTPARAQSVQTNGIFGGLLLGGTTNIISDNGAALTRNGVPITGGAGMAGAVSNNVASAGLLAVDATKTNGIAATFGHVTNALGYLPATNASLGNYVLKAGDTMTGDLLFSSASVTNYVSHWFSTNIANVRDWGAVGDGVTVDTLSISNALKASSTVYFPPGTYLTGLLYPTNNQLLYGNGNASVLKLYGPKTVNTLMIRCGSNSVSFTDLLFDGGTNGNFNQLTVASTATGIVHYAIGSATIKGCTFQNFQTGLYVDGTNSILTRPNNSAYLANVITNCQYGLFLGDNNAAEYSIVQANRIRGTYIGFLNYSAANVDFVGNEVVDCGFYGLSAVPTSKRGHTLYSGNFFNHLPQSISAGINLSGVNDAMFVGNHILTGSFVLTSCTNVNFMDNLIDTTSITFSGGASNILSHNTITGAGAATLSGAAATNVWFSGNRRSGVGAIWSQTSGTATIASGQTSTNITHNLAITPLASDILLTPQNNLGNATKFWISAVSSTTFTISVDADPGATTAIFSWRHVE